MIIYSRTEADTNFFGFSIMDSKKAFQYMKAVDALANEEDEMTIGDLFPNVLYDSADFTKMKLTNSDINVLQKLFDMDEDTESIGIFPNAISDAYDSGLIDEDTNEE